MLYGIWDGILKQEKDLSKKALTGAVSTIKFFLSEAFLGRHFETVELEGSEPEPGDLFLFRLLSPTGRWCGAHVGVYCGHGEIIHFEGCRAQGPQGLGDLAAGSRLIWAHWATPAGRNVAGQGPHPLLGSYEGIVSKQGQRPMLRSRSLWHVLRRRGGVDRVALEHRVREAMDADPPPYHPTRSNCVHFALRLLGPMPIPDPLQIDSGPINSVSAAQLPLHHLTSPPKPVNKCR
ncbi:uncharacterized protein AAEQ78_006409 [Lycaon pictus]